MRTRTILILLVIICVATLLICRASFILDIGARRNKAIFLINAQMIDVQNLNKTINLSKYDPVPLIQTISPPEGWAAVSEHCVKYYKISPWIIPLLLSNGMYMATIVFMLVRPRVNAATAT